MGTLRNGHRGQTVRKNVEMEQELVTEPVLILSHNMVDLTVLVIILLGNFVMLTRAQVSSFFF